MKVLALTRYGRSGASSRVRFYQFENELSKRGAEIDWSPLLGEGYLERLYAEGRRSIIDIFPRYLERVRVALSAKRYDVVWLEKEALPWMPSLLDPKTLCRFKYIVDYDDAVFHTYDEHRNRFLRFFFGKKIDVVMRQAAHVIAGNDYIAGRALEKGCRNVTIIPSVVDAERYRSRGETAEGRGAVIGWIGSPASQHLLSQIVPVLKQVTEDSGAYFVTVGARFERPLFARHLQMQWNEENEPELVSMFDVGIMPVVDAPFERGKCGYKLIQYMASGLPVVASPVGVNSRIVVHGETGYLATTNEEWFAALHSLCKRKDDRLRMGACGRRRFESNYSLSVAAPMLWEVMQAVAGS